MSTKFLADRTTGNPVDLKAERFNQGGANLGAMLAVHQCTQPEGGLSQMLSGHLPEVNPDQGIASGRRFGSGSH